MILAEAASKTPWWLILAIVLGVIVLILIIATIVMKALLKPNNTVKQPDEVIIGNGQEGKKALLIYQPTKHDSGKNAAQAIADKLHDKGYRVDINHPSAYLNYNVDDYDLLVFGSGAYAFTAAPVLLSYMSSLNLKDKNVFVFSVGVIPREKSQEFDAFEKLTAGAAKVSMVKIKGGENDKIAGYIEDFVATL